MLFFVLTGADNSAVRTRITTCSSDECTIVTETTQVATALTANTQGPSWTSWTAASPCTKSCGGKRNETSSCVVDSVQSVLCSGKMITNLEF